MTAKTQPGAIPEGVETTPTAAWEAAFLSFNPKGWEECDRLGRAVEAAILADRAARPDQPEAPGVEAARKAVQSLGAILSLKPHSQEPGLSAHYFEWVQGVERVHAEIRDALDRAASRTSSSDRIRQESAEERIREEVLAELLKEAKRVAKSGGSSSIRAAGSGATEFLRARQPNARADRAIKRTEGDR